MNCGGIGCMGGLGGLFVFLIVIAMVYFFFGHGNNWNCGPGNC